MEGWYKKLSPKIQFFVDEIEPNVKNVPNHHFVFTNLICLLFILILLD